MRNVGAVILAAGGSSRLGQPKQLLSLQGESLMRRAVRAAIEAGCTCVTVVAGDARDRIESELRGTPAVVVENLEWQRGLGTSIRCGLRHLLSSPARNRRRCFAGLRSTVSRCDRYHVAHHAAGKFRQADGRLQLRRHSRHSCALRSLLFRSASRPPGRFRRERADRIPPGRGRANRIRERRHRHRHARRFRRPNEFGRGFAAPSATSNALNRKALYTLKSSAMQYRDRGTPEMRFA